MLAAKAAVDAVCARHGLQRSDLQAQLDILGLDVDSVDVDAANVQKVDRHPLCIASTQHCFHSGQSMMLVLGMTGRVQALLLGAAHLRRVPC